MPKDLTIAQLNERKLTVDKQRTNWRDQWMDLSQYILPYTGRFEELGDNPANSGLTKGDKIVDSTATKAVRVLAAGMQSGLTSPSRPWFRLELEDQALAKNGNVKNWLDEVERRMLTALARSNFYTSTHAGYSEQAVYGTSGHIELEDRETDIRFLRLTLGRFSLMTNDKGMVDTVFRHQWMTNQQMAGKFGIEALTKDMQNQIREEQNLYAWHKVNHGIYPRSDTNPGERIDNRSMPWASVWWEPSRDDDKVLMESGFTEFPAQIGRWLVEGDDSYGTGPGADNLADIKMMQEMAATSLRGIHQVIDPPTVAPSAMQDAFSTLPGAVNFGDETGNNAARALYQVNLDIASMEAKLEKIQGAVREGFFNDLFLLIARSGPNMTATEVIERHEEKLLILGPVIERQQSEFLDPMIDRTFNILLRNGKLPEVPQELEGQLIKVIYIGLLAQAQREVATRAITSSVGFVQALAQAQPEALDKLNVDEAIDVHSELVGAPGKMIRPNDEANAIRQARIQAQKAEQAKLDAQAAVDAGKTLSETDMSGDSALTQLADAAGAQ